MRQIKFLFKIDWWNSYQEKDETDYGILVAENYVDAMTQLNECFEWICCVNLEEMDDEGENFLWLNKENYDNLRINNNYLNEGPIVTIEKCGQESLIPVTEEEDRWFAEKEE